MRHATPRSILALAAALAGAAPLAAQTPQDSLAERVRRVEEALARQSAPTVRSRSGHTIEISGLLLVNGFYNDGKTNNSDVPVYADTATAAEAGLPTRNAGAAVRQTRLNLAVTDARALGAMVSGQLQVDFFGGQQPSAGGRTFPLLRLRVASVRLDWAHVGLLVGQDAPLIATQNPVSYASFATPLFASSGNLWFRAPQVRLGAETPGRAHLGVQAAALAPLQPDTQGVFATQPNGAERSARPSVEARLYLAWGEGDVASELGVAAHAGWLATKGDSLLRSEVAALDGRVALGRRLSVAGEAFIGKALGAFGGGVGQNFGAGGVPLRSRGGWVQLDVRPGGGWQFGGGLGMDEPEGADLTSTSRGRNLTYAGHLIWRPGGGVLFGVEGRRIETTYARGTLAVHHINGYAGLAF